MNPRRPWIVRILVALSLLGAFLLGRGFDDRNAATPTPGGEATEARTWTCSMHPQIQLPQPGACPICGMDLIPLAVDDAGDREPRALRLSPAAQARAGIRTAPVERRSVEVGLRMVGKLEPDESRVREIAAWVPGRIDRLHIDSTGVRVREGQDLFDLYSPDLYSAQEELLQAIRAADQLGRSRLASSREAATRTVHAAREKLRLWGLTTSQVQALVERGTPAETVTIVAPLAGTVLHKAAQEGGYVETGTHVYSIGDLSVLWLQLDVYESDLGWIREGQPVRFTTESHPGREFRGTVSFIDPVLDERTRSVKARVEVDNADRRLKPGMFARAEVFADVDGGDGPPLVIPRTAPLVTGTRAVVYVPDPGEPGRFVGREIELGPQAGEFVVVRAGLAEGERVVTHGNFKIDSALQIQARPSMMNPDAGHAQHDHTAPPASTVERIDGVPPAFRRALDDLVRAYLEVADALAHDDLDTARRAASTLPEAVQRPLHSQLPAAGHGPWSRAQEVVDRAAREIATAGDLAAARRAFHPLSETAIEVLRRFGTPGTGPVFVYHCPVATDGAGAEWLQSTEGTQNPYYGSQMFGCGAESDVLDPGPGEDR